MQVSNEPGGDRASMPGYLWVVTGLCVWIGSLVFAAFGLFMGTCELPSTAEVAVAPGRLRATLYLSRTGTLRRLPTSKNSSSRKQRVPLEWHFATATSSKT